MRWTLRAFGRAEAARLLGIPVGRLDLILHRQRPIADLFSGKHGDRRVFSLRDICVLRLAHVLERFGRTWLFAIADAVDVLEQPPPADAVLKVTLGRSLPVPRGLTEPGPVDEPTLFIPVGRIVQDIKEDASVAVHQ